MLRFRAVSDWRHDRNVTAVLGLLVVATVTACTDTAGPDAVTGDTGPTVVSGQQVLPTVGAVDLAYLFPDRPALHQVVAQAPATTPADAATADLSVSVDVSGDGTIMATALTPPTSCVTGTSVQPAGRDRTVPRDYATIQAAIDAAGPGDVVRVQPGMYHETVHLKSDVSLIGAGASNTILDARGDAVSLIDFSGARNTVVQGFTLTGVGQPSGCAQPDDPFYCSGNWYAAAIYGDGSATYDGPDPCADTSILVTQNFVTGNVIGMMSYFHARAVVRNNVFVGNTSGFVANHLQDHALLLQNAFFENSNLAIGSQAAYLDVIGNIIVGSQVGLRHEYIQTGRISCNVFAQTADPGVASGDQGNMVLDSAFVDAANGDYRPTAELIAAVGNCLDVPLPDAVSWASSEPGAFGGVLGRWVTP